MYIGQIGSSSYFCKNVRAQQNSALVAISSRLQVQSVQRNRDRVMIGNGREDKESGIYKPCINNMRAFSEVSYTKVKPDEKLQAEILPASEKGEYTERDALLNQYMKQFRIDAKIEGDTFITSADQPVRIMLPDMVSDEELEEFRKSLSNHGLGQEIDWQGVKNDFWNMGVGLDNAERLETKADYLASRYIVLKDRIQKQFTGDEQAQQMDILNQIYTDAKEEMAEKYATEIGGFYEELGQEGAASEFRISIMEMVDKKSAQYEAYLSGNDDYANAVKAEDSWLLQDDAYMAAQLRERQAADSQNIQMAAEEEHYSIDDLMLAGVYAQSLTSQLQNVHRIWDVEQDDSALGLFLAKQEIDTQEIVKSANISNKMENLINSIFKPYIGKFMDAVDKVLDQQQEMVNEKPWMSGILRTEHLDRDRVYHSYQNALAN